ncbi:MAG: vWA domain-containing protein [Caldilineaceae bacterium]|jgi:uncharacterized protein YegL
MNEHLSEIVCIVDRSGSMDAIRTDAIGGFNTFLADQKQEPGNARLSLVLFNHEYKLVYDNVKIDEVRPLEEKTYVPQGMTALLDAVGRTIDAVGERLSRTPEPERPAKVIVAILTDGLENASKDYSRGKVAEMIQHQREKYSWEFIFLAANQDAIASARSISIDAEDAIAFQATGAGVRHAHMQMSQEIARRRRS